MKILVTAALLAFSASAAAAAPFPAKTDVAAGNSVIKVHETCHNDWRTHGGYYPRHYHGRGCRMIVEETYAPPPRWDRQRYRNYRHDDTCVTLGTPAFGFSFCD